MKNNRARDDNGCCSLLFLKYVVFVFNLVFWVTGIAFLAIGIWTLNSKHDYISLLGNNMFGATTILFISIGVIILLVGVLGCIGTLKSIRFCLVTYACLLIVILLLEAISGVLAYMHEGAIRDELTRNLNSTMVENYRFDTRIDAAVDSMQKEFQCCGAGSYLDWKYSRWLRLDTTTKNKTPDSCCITPSNNCAARDHPSNIYWIGCSRRLEQFVKGHLIIIGGIGLGFCCIQIFGIIFACCLARKIKESKEGF